MFVVESFKTHYQVFCTYGLNYDRAKVSLLITSPDRREPGNVPGTLPPSSLNRRKPRLELRNSQICKFIIAFHASTSPASSRLDWLLVAHCNRDEETKNLRSQVVSNFEGERNFIRGNVLRPNRHWSIKLVELILHTGAFDTIGTRIKENRWSNNYIRQNCIYCRIHPPRNNAYKVDYEEEKCAFHGWDNIEITHVRGKQSQLKFWAPRSV